MEPPPTPVHRLLGLCLLLLLGSTSHAAPGDVDSLNLNLGTGFNGAVLATAMQPDGKTIIAGIFTSVLGVSRSNIARLNADGTLDTGFNSSANNSILSVVVQADGKILLGGTFTGVGGTARNYLARVAADGAVDMGFNPNVNGGVGCMAVQSDGKILLGGSFTSVGGIARNRIARVNANGTLDAAFNPDVNGGVGCMALQADGKILLGGTFGTVGGITRYNIARVEPNGTLDLSFDPNPNAGAEIYSVVVQPDGKILIGGLILSMGGTTRYRIARVEANGSLDLNFNPNVDDWWVSRMALQSDGKILLAGNFTSIGGIKRSRIARLAADGSLDMGFNPSASRDVYGLAMQPDGKILIGGNFTSVGGNYRNLFARLVNDPATQTLGAVDNTQVLWARGGSAPEVTQTTFELSTNGGSSYTLLGGTATRVGSTAYWKLTGLNLPASGLIRARGRPSGDASNGSLVEQVLSFSGLQAPALAVSLVTPVIGTTAGGTSVTITGSNFTGTTSVTFGGIPATSFTVDSPTQITATIPPHPAGMVDVRVAKPEGIGTGTVLFTYVQPPTVTASTSRLPNNATLLTIIGTGFSTTPGENTVTFTPTGSGTVTNSTATTVTVTGISGLSLGALNAVVTTNGISSDAPVQVATVVVPGPGDADALDVNVPGNYVYATAMQPDGKTIIAGSFTSVLGVMRNNIARLNADGTLDAGFNPDANSSVHSVVVQADGQVLLGGYFTRMGGTVRKYIARVAADGTLDMGFNPNADWIVSCLAVQADGKILLGGNFSSVGGIARNNFARVEANGTLDASFNPDPSSQVESVAVQADGKILLGGYFSSVGATTRFKIARVAANGTLDMGFDPSANDIVSSVVVQADGKILLGGEFTSVGGITRNRVARVTVSGTLDMDFNPNANNRVRSMAAQADGKILLGGNFTAVGGGTRSRIARVEANGTLDAGFSSNANGEVHCVTMQADGQVLLGGRFTIVGETLRNNFARLLNDPAIQTLSAMDSTQVLWTRSGSAPDVTQSTFELSTNGGSSYTPLGGMATRAGSTAHWKLTGLNLPASGWLRARGRPSGGANNGSLVEQLVSFSELQAPVSTVTLVTPAFGSTAGGKSVTITGTNFTGATSVTFGGTAATSFTVVSATQITATIPAHQAETVDVVVTKPGGAGIGTYLFTYTPPPTVTASSAKLLTITTTLTITGTGFSSTPGENTVTFTPTGSGVVTTSSGTSLTVTGISGLTPGALRAVVTSKSVSSGAPVQVATVMVPGPGDVDLLNANVSGGLVTCAAVQPDGKIIIAGTFSSVLGVDRYNIARLNANGTLDTGFNLGTDGYVFSVVVQADGKILLGGEFTYVYGAEWLPRNYIARVAPNGTLDTGFDPNPNGPVQSVTVQADGNILLGGGFSSVGGTTRNCIARLNADGTLDAGFNPDAEDDVFSIAVQADGQILLGGQFDSMGGTTRNCIARVAADGTLDPSFDPDANSSVRSIALQADGKILLGGSFTSVGGVPRNLLARVAANGTLDMGFNPNPNGNVDSIVVQADGKILLGGRFTSISGSTRNRIARVAPDGTLDVNFDPNANDDVDSVAVQADGKILIGGFFFNVGGIPRNRIARLYNGPATQTLSVVDSTQVLWTRGGSAPDVSQPTFELSTDGGISYTKLEGTAKRGGSTAHWKLSGLNLPASGRLRARGRTLGGYFNNSSGLIEQVINFSGLQAPVSTVTLITPVFGSTAGGTSVTITGTNFTGVNAVAFGGTPASSFTVNSDTQITATVPARVAGTVDVRVSKFSGSAVGTYLYTYVQPPTVTASTARLANTATMLTITGTGFSTTPGTQTTVAFTPTGSGTVVAVGETYLTVTGITGLSMGALNAVVTSNGFSSGAAVQVATVVEPGLGEADALNANVVGDYVFASAVQPDGKTIIAGTFTSVLGQPRNNIARMNPDGTLDMGFNPVVDNTVFSVAVQADGKILLGGGFTKVNGTTRNRIARVTANGTLDAGFVASINNSALCVALQADGKILLGGGFTRVGSATRNYIARLEADGTLDAGFNPNANNWVYSVVVQADSQILLGGAFTSMGGTSRNYIARVHLDGTLDADFNPNASDWVNSMTVQADGKILLGGSFTSVGGTVRNRIARVTANGNLDMDFNPNANSSVRSIGVQADGQILLGGFFTRVGGITRNGIARLAANGTLDTGFNPNANDDVYSVEVVADGQILLGGSFTNVGGADRNKFARLINAPATQTLSMMDATQVLWSRGGSTPEVTQTTIELSTDGGSTYTPLGTATRMGSTADWQLTGLSLPPRGILRARGRATGGNYNGSSGLVEQVIDYSGQLPDIAVTQVNPLDDDVSNIVFANTLPGSSHTLIFTITNPSFIDLTSLAITKDGPDAADFTVSELSATSIPAGPGTATFTVTFSPTSGVKKTASLHIASNVIGEKNPFDIALTGPAYPEPTVSAIIPSSGPASGGTAVTITGMDFSENSSVTIGGSSATSVTVVNSTTLTAVTQIGIVGSASVLVTTYGGINAENSLFTYEVPVFDIAVAQAGPLVDGMNSVLFSKAQLGGSSAPLTFTITNEGNTDLTSLAVTKDGPDAADFTVSELSSTSIPAGPGTAAFTVTFSPKSVGAKTATLHIASNASGSKNPFDITLIGIGRVSGQASQTLAFTPPAKLHLSEGPLTLSARASSGLPVVYTVISGPATVLGNVLTLSGPGAVKVRASQPGNADFLAAVPVERTITVAANPKTLTLANLRQTYTGTPREITVLEAAGPVNVTYKVGSNYVSDAPIHVGSYAVKAVAGAITKTGTLVITQAPLFVQPYDQRKFAGQVNPALGFAYSGFLGGDNATNSVTKAPVISTTATATSAGGLYPITSKGGASANYLFFHQKGTMKVETFAASYEALLVNDGNWRPSAKLELTVAASSKTFSGKLTTATETSAMPLKGTLTTNTANETATGTATVKKGENTYLVEFTLPLTGDFTAMAKRNGATLGGPTNGSKLLTLAKGQTLSYIGTHSAMLAPVTALVGVPAGAGWAVATIDAKGLLKLTGKLADGAGLTASLAADVSSDPGYRLFIQPYTPARTGSFLAGAFTLKPQTDDGLIGRRYVAFEDAAAFTWVKAERQQDSAYRAGFGPVDTRFTLDPWLPPVPAKGLVPAITLATRLGLSSPANQFSVEHSTINSASYSELPMTLALPGATSAVSIIAPSTTPANRTKWKITITPATGAFVGSFELIDVGKKRSVPFTGILRQPPSTDTSGLIGDGNFQLPSLLPAPNNQIMSGEVGFER
jgi:uncharacterized delta-60 repeat protein